MRSNASLPARALSRVHETEMRIAEDVRHGNAHAVEVELNSGRRAETQLVFLLADVKTVEIWSDNECAYSARAFSLVGRICSRHGNDHVSMTAARDPALCARESVSPVAPSLRCGAAASDPASGSDSAKLQVIHRAT